MRLALEMGEPDVDGLLSRISFTQFLEWRAFDQVEPIGGARADWHAAQICATVVNMTLARGGSDKTVNPEDFLLKFKPRGDAKKEHAGQRQTWQEQKLIARMFVAMSNADEAKKKRSKRKK